MPEKLKRALSFVPVLAMIGMVVPGAGTQTQKAPDAREHPTPLIQSVKGLICSGSIVPRAMVWMPKGGGQRLPR